VGLLGLSLLIMGWGDLFTLAKWIDCDHEYLLPYIFAVLLSISYPTGILINYSLQYLNKARLKIKSLLKSKESDNKSKESDNSTKEYIEIMCSDRTGLVIKELEIRYRCDCCDRGIH